MVRCVRLLALMGACLLLAACASAWNPFVARGEQAFEAGKALLADGRTEEGLAQLEKAVREDPRNVEYRTTLIRKRTDAINQWLNWGDADRAAKDYRAATVSYQRVLALDPQNDRANFGLGQVRSAQQYDLLLREAAGLLNAGRVDEAQARLRKVLTETPSNAEALALSRQIEDQAQKKLGGAAVLGAAFRKPLTIEFRDANLRSIFEVMARTTGINFVFDKDVKPDIKATIFLKDTTLEDAVNMLLTTNQLEKRVLNENSVLVYPNTPAKAKEYQELVVKTFYLANADVKQTMSMIKTLVKTKDVFIDEKLNMLTMRDTADAVRLAEKLVAGQDLAEPEVVLEVEVLEVKRSRLLDLGIQYPNQFTVLNIVPQAGTTTISPGGSTIVQNPTTTTTSQLTLQTLKNITSGNIAISPAPQANAKSESGDANLLANPRIRVKNREKARVHIGDKVPVITTTSTANVGVSENVTYLDVGIKLDVEPNVFLEDEVSIKVGLEVSNIVREVTSRNGTLTYQLGTRQAATTLRLRNGETQALAGLISDEDRKSANKIPGLGDLPLLGRLFGTQRDDRQKTEIILLITPRIVRNLPTLDASAREYASGTEAAAGAAPLRLRPGSSVALPMSQAASAPAPVEPTPETPPEAPVTVAAPPPEPAAAKPPVAPPPSGLAPNPSAQ